MLKQFLAMTVVVACLATTTGCTAMTPYVHESSGTGALIGGGLGALPGIIAGNGRLAVLGAAAGAAIGGGAGAIVGRSQEGYPLEGGYYGGGYQRRIRVNCSDPETWQELSFCQGVLREQREQEYRRQRYFRERERMLEEAGRRRVRYGW